jgi:epsilon-lactone hydrolase
MSTAEERTIRTLLPLVRLSIAYLPLSAMRGLQRMGENAVKMAAGITRETISADGVPCEWIVPQGSSKDRVLLYLHGGGFVYGWMNAHRQMVAHLAQATGVRALCVDYRLAPEHPFPEPLDDCVAAYRWLLKQGISPQQIVIAGDSAGANLTLTTLLKLRDMGEPLPSAVVCLSPPTDLSNRDEFFRGVTDPLLHPKATTFFRLSYLGNNDPQNPLISPIYGDFHGMPPMLIHAGDDEFLRHDAQQLEKRVKEAGVDVRLEIYPRMWHVWQISLTLPQAQHSLADIAQFIKAHLGVTNEAEVRA